MSDLSHPKTPLSDLPALYVAIGASAGGLEAIEAFFSGMVPDSGLAFIVIQHLSPDYKSLMVEILSKKTAMHVLRAEDGMRVEANTVYLIPPKKNLTIFHGELFLSDQAQIKGLINLPIDVFLRSLAEDQEEKAVAVILSGSGSDGMRGVRTIKEYGGMVMVQKEDTARFDSMPRAALSTGLADFVLPPDEMPERLLAYVKHPYVSKVERMEGDINDADALPRIFSLLRDRFKVDFTHYKPSTVLRRIERRLSINRVDGMREYLHYMQNYPGEAGVLFRELLIGVTRFFRDREVFDALSEQWMPVILGRKDSRETRIWVAGCSTGEEAYTLAILAKETMQRANISRDVKIFATDIDREAIQSAANGVYPESIAADVPPEFLTKYFFRQKDSFQITRSIREMVVFAQHNLIKDPPFTRIDLVSCRNLLIYLQPILQQKVLEFFNFSLSPSGILLLGSSESTGDMGAYFETLDLKNKIFRNVGRVKPLVGDMMQDMEMRQPDRAGRMPRRTFQNADERLLDRLLEGLQEEIPLSLVVNEHLEVLHVIGETEGFFRLPSGRLTTDITKMAVKELAIPLSTGIQKVFRTGEPLRFSNIRMWRGEYCRTLNLRIKPLPMKKGQEPLVLVMVEEVRSVETEALPPTLQTYDLSREAEQRISDLEQELQFSRENLQATVEELETSNEELQATNEELLASNEELQSTNEELQSTNEELYSVNSEYQSKIMELSELHNDVDNLLSASQIGQLLLDENLEIRRFSEKVSEIFAILDTDLGRPLSHIAHHLENVDPIGEIAGVQKSGLMRELEVRTRSGRWYLMRVVPYLVGPEVFSGMLISFVDISRIMDAEKELRETVDLLKRTQELAHIGSWILDLDTWRLTWSDETYRIFGLAPENFCATYEAFLDLVHPEDRAAVDGAYSTSLREGRSGYQVEHRIFRKDTGEIRHVQERCVHERDRKGRIIRSVGMVFDITENKILCLPCSGGGAA